MLMLARFLNGIGHVLVNGTFIVQDGRQLVTGVLPGGPIRAALAE